jgi:hypothetical protein
VTGHERNDSKSIPERGNVFSIVIRSAVEEDDTVGVGRCSETENTAVTGRMIHNISVFSVSSQYTHSTFL